jgi:glycosyltransferase involved in cell wall biosynthesis
MRLIVSSHYHYIRTRDGAAWSRTMFARSFWERYLAVFDSVVVVARARSIDADAPPEGWSRADGPNVELSALPYFVGPKQYLVAWPQIKKAARHIVKRGDAVIARAPSREGSLILKALPAPDYPFGLEVVADPYEIFSPGAVDHPTRPLFRWWDTRTLRDLCARSSATAYVTKRALQSRYPPGRDAYSIGCSDVELSDEAFVEAPRGPPSHGGPIRIVSIGSLAQAYKGIDVLIDAVARLLGRNFPVELRVVGGGRLQTVLAAQAERLGVADRIIFLGELPAGAQIRRELDGADLFVLPSRSEGLPRALVEAMARGLPCVATHVGGVPELLDPSVLVPRADAEALAGKIYEVSSNPSTMSALSRYNLAKAREYRDQALQPQRESFYRELRSKTARWLERAGA